MGKKLGKEAGDCLRLCLRDAGSQVEILIRRTSPGPPVLPNLPELTDIDTRHVQLSARCLLTFHPTLFGHLRASSWKGEFNLSPFPWTFFYWYSGEKLQRKVCSVTVQVCGIAFAVVFCCVWFCLVFWIDSPKIKEVFLLAIQDAGFTMSFAEQSLEVQSTITKPLNLGIFCHVSKLFFSCHIFTFTFYIDTLYWFIG